MPCTLWSTLGDEVPGCSPLFVSQLISKNLNESTLSIHDVPNLFQCHVWYIIASRKHKEGGPGHFQVLNINEALSSVWVTAGTKASFSLCSGTPFFPFQPALGRAGSVRLPSALGRWGGGWAKCQDGS